MNSEFWKKHRKRNFTVRYPLAEKVMVDLDKEIGENPGGTGSNPGSVADTVELPAASFNFAAADMLTLMPEWYSGRYAHPAGIYRLSHSADDAPRVRAMFSGDFSTSPQPASSTLLKNMGTALNTFLQNYYDTADRRGLITSPLRVGAALRFSDGSRRPLGKPSILVPDSEAPYPVIRSYSFGETSTQAVLEILNIPAVMKYSLPAFSSETLAALSSDAEKSPVAVDFYATAQSAFSPEPLTFYDIRTIVVGEGTAGEERVRAFIYNRYDSAYVTGHAESDSVFRVIGTVPFDQVKAGVALLDVPLREGALFDFRSMPAMTWSPDGKEEDPEPEPDPFNPHIHWMTPALDLGDPEAEKRVRSVILRGVYPRDKVRMTLRCSHHREHWRVVASGTGPVLRYVSGVRARWWRVEIETDMRRGDFLEALSFLVSGI